MKKTAIAIAAATLLSISTGATAQGAGGTIDTSYGNPQPQEEDGFPWGLLGLLGLAGLLGRKRRDHTTVDNRTTR
jgi:MYXO-CTERM domain-containing protein